jgi:hypothetical protein
MKKTILVTEQTRSFIAGIEAAKCGNSINNSYPFNFEEFVAGYKSIKPKSKTMNELLELDEATIVSTIKNADQAKSILKTRHDIEELLRFENELR